MENYIIQYGDTLKKIAKEKLGNEERWYEIAQLNNLQSPYQLYIGEKIKLPNRISMFKPSASGHQRRATTRNDVLCERFYVRCFRAITDNWF